MGASISVDGWDATTETVALTIVLDGSEPSEGESYYIDIKNSDSSFYTNIATKWIPMSALDRVQIETGMTGMGRVFTGTSKTFRVRWRSYSGTTTCVLPMSNTPSSYTIPERPMQQTQYVTYNGVSQGQAGSCVANATASCIEVLKMRTGNTVYPYSVGWIYGGAGDGSTEWLEFEPCFNFLKSSGSPPAQVLTYGKTTGYPDVYFQSDAKSLYNSNYSSALKYATPQRIGSWTKLTGGYTWNYTSIFNAIQRSNTVVVMTLNINQALDDASSSGWVGAIKNSTRGGHCVIVLGWVNNGGKYYWVVQNSWCTSNGYPYGDNGIFYIPFDHYTYDGHGIWDFYALTRDESAPTMPALPEDTGMPVLIKRLANGFELSCNYIASATYEFRYRKEGTTTYETKTSSTNSVTIYGDYGYTYLISVRFLRNGIYSPFSKESTCTVLPQLPDIVVYSTTSTNLVAKVVEETMSGKYSYFKILRSASTDFTNILDYKTTTMGTPVEWTGLTKGTKYYFSALTVLSVNGATLESYYRSSAILGVVGNIRPPFFSWDAPKVKGQPVVVTADEWNKLTNNISQMLAYKGKTQRTFTTVYPNTPIYSSIFREVRNAITFSTGLGSSVSIPTPYIDTEMTAEHFNKLVESLNSVV